MLGVHGFPDLILIRKKKIIYQDNIYVTNIIKKKRIRIVDRQNCGIHTQASADQIYQKPRN